MVINEMMRVQMCCYKIKASKLCAALSCAHGLNFWRSETHLRPKNGIA